MEKVSNLCSVCGKKFIKTVPNKKYCSTTCSRNSLYLNYQNKTDVKSERTCLSCKTKFKPKAHNQTFCKKECRIDKLSFDYISKNIDNFPSDGSYAWLKARVVVMDRDSFRCVYCGRSPMNDKSVTLHIDHKIPKKLGGSDKIDNLVTACEQCNIGKSDLLLNFWKNEKNTLKKKNQT